MSYESNEGTRWLGSGEPVDPADVLQPGDPPISSLTLLEVAEDARQRAIEARKTALRFMVATALVAIARGEDPRAVAKACGWSDEDARLPPDATVQTPLGPMIMSDLMYAGFPVQQQDQMERFAEWLADGVKHLIKEGLDR